MSRSGWGLSADQEQGLEVLADHDRSGRERITNPPKPAPHVPVSLVLLVGVGVLLALMVVALLVGSVELSPDMILRILGHRICGDGCITPNWKRSQDLIVADTRLPRVLLAAVCGAGLSTAGMVIQALVRNPLAGPGILGVSSGAATGAVLVLRFAVIGGLGVFALNAAAFLGAMLALGIVFVVSHSAGHVDATRLILAGTAVSAVLSAITSLLVITAPDQTLAGQVLQWTLGGFGGATWKTLPAPLIGVIALLVALLPLGRLLNLSIMGDDAAVSLGLDINRFRRILIVVSALVVSLIVAVSGVISFVGLMLPHVARLLVGADHRKALPVSALLGAIFMVATDLMARRLAAPIELPVGIITSIIGGPVFLILIQRRLRDAS